MVRKVWFFTMVFMLLLAACAGLNPTFEPAPPEPTPEDPQWTQQPTPITYEPPPNPYQPGKGDESMQRSEVFIDSQQVQAVEGDPLAYELLVSGSLPTPCHELRVMVNPPDEQNRMDVIIFSLVDPNAICIQVLEPFEATIPLGTYPSGTYTVWVNGVQAGEMAF
jgi:hypothetical protein